MIQLPEKQRGFVPDGQKQNPMDFIRGGEEEI